MKSMIKNTGFNEKMPDWIFSITDKVQDIIKTFTNKERGLRASIINFRDIISPQSPCKVDDLLNFFMVMEVYGT